MNVGDEVVVFIPSRFGPKTRLGKITKITPKRVTVDNHYVFDKETQKSVARNEHYKFVVPTPEELRQLQKENERKHQEYLDREAEEKRKQEDPKYQAIEFIRSTAEHQRGRLERLTLDQLQTIRKWIEEA